MAFLVLWEVITHILLKVYMVVWGRTANFPLGEFVRANSKKVGNDPTFSRLIFSLTNHIAKIYFSLRAKKFA
jgi:hypothetical protein